MTPQPQQFQRRLRYLAKTFRRIVTVMLVVMPTAVLAAGGVTYTDIATSGGAGLDYARTVSGHFPMWDSVRQGSLTTPLTFNDLPFLPHRPYGITGVAIVDFDRDGDQDIYVTNGPGSANSLFSNQLVETGRLTFVDVATTAGVDATRQDSFGMCFGDTDNDGDPELLVLGRNEPNRFFVNNGDRTFTEDVTTTLGGGNLSSVGCSMGDVNGDGRIDIAIGNTFDFVTTEAIFLVPHALNQANQLFLNMGANAFIDISAESGIEELAGFVDSNGNPAPAKSQGVTWAIAMADVDSDGDIDIIFADDQGPMPDVEDAGDGVGFDRGLVHVLLNDGTGQFADSPAISDSIYRAGAWMGLAFGDLNADGAMDMHVPNFGDYNAPSFGLPDVLGNFSMAFRRWRCLRDTDVIGGAEAFGWARFSTDTTECDILYAAAGSGITSDENQGTMLHRLHRFCAGRAFWSGPIASTSTASAQAISQ